MNVHYDVLPYSNSEFCQAMMPTNRRWCSMGSEKVEGLIVGTRDGGASEIPGLLDMDLSVTRVEPMPFKLELSWKGNVAFFIPDFMVHDVCGASWAVHVATSSMIDGRDGWICQAAVAAMEDMGTPLAIISPAIENSAYASDMRYPQSRSGNYSILPEMGTEIAEIVDAAPDRRISINEIAKCLRRNGWAERDAQIQHALQDYASLSYAYESVATSKIFRAVREGYVDFDPASGKHGTYAPIHPRLSFLDQRTALSMLDQFVVAGDRTLMKAMAEQAKDAVRSAPSPSSIADAAPSPRP